MESDPESERHRADPAAPKSSSSSSDSSSSSSEEAPETKECVQPDEAVLDMLSESDADSQVPWLYVPVPLEVGTEYELRNLIFTSCANEELPLEILLSHCAMK